MSTTEQGLVPRTDDTFAKRLKTIRVAFDLTQLEAATKADVHDKTWAKGRRQRVVGLHPLCVDALGEWGIPDIGHLFTRADGGPLWPSQVSGFVARFFDRLHIDATAHHLRHRFGTRLYAQTKDIRLVQEAMGHASSATTDGYTKVTPERAAAAVVAL
jgi:integrase